MPVRLLGHPGDTADWVSSVVPKNGFNPTWEEEVEFKVRVPELALVEFKVLPVLDVSFLAPGIYRLKAKLKWLEGWMITWDHLPLRCP